MKDCVVLDVDVAHAARFEVLPRQVAKAVEHRALGPALDVARKREVRETETKADGVRGEEGEVLVRDEPPLEALVHPRRAPAVEVDE